MGIRKGYMLQNDISPARSFALGALPFGEFQKTNEIAHCSDFFGKIPNMPADNLFHYTIEAADGIEHRRKSAHGNFLLHKGIKQEKENPRISKHRAEAHQKFQPVGPHGGRIFEPLDILEGFPVKLRKKC